ncbi:hypothetical protein DEU56DRAFT_725506 [Suillus clintonianus]|uniref:uncharacterized protein n=1 Tax=Suillus clintonianus TaxID=1904413 RepID=UPI001B86C5CC|nr:uncharacterized protein DEU56DRAFT_725506 [Suillus clintonianus]KAG2154735.1 hypothetical protein DEU56DRAFT_725506 [Suillus clintonianus]
MPDAALQPQLHQNSSTSSPPPTSPVQSTLDLLVNPTSSPPRILANKIGEQFQHSNHIQSSQSSNNNGILNSHPPVTSAPPSILSNPDPNASLQSLLAANRKDSAAPDSLHQWGIPPVQVPPPPQHSSPHLATSVGQSSNGKSGKRKLDETEPDDPHPKMRRPIREHVAQHQHPLLQMTTVMCLHAAVAQKSYGSEKRFLCPPPVVHIQGPVWQMRSQQLAMSVVSEQGERSLDQKTNLDNNMTGSFKFLHVTGTAKAKSFQLSLDIIEPPPSALSGESSADGTPGRVWATFDSAPVTIISKPSKKTAKTRNISSCILAGGPVSLFNRINSQTVRTKYMTIDNSQLCASNVTWSAFNVNVVRRPDDAPPTNAGPQPVTYGCEVVLSDTLSNIATSPLIIRKVDKGRVSAEDGGPVSQMQKIALQRVNQDGSRHYLSAAGPIPGAPNSTPSVPGAPAQGGTHPLIFQSPRIRDEMKDGVRTLTDEVDDYLCWTIVGISKFQYTFFDAFGQHSNSIPEMPITPFPTLFTAPVYRPTNNILEMTVSHFFYEDPKTRTQMPLTVYLGGLGPLRARFYQAAPPGPLTNIAAFGAAMSGSSNEVVVGGGEDVAGSPADAASRYLTQPPLHTIVTVELPSLPEIIKALEEDVMTPSVMTSDGLIHRQSSQHNEHGAPLDGPNGNGSQSHPPPSIAGRNLPLLFIRASDGIGYHSGRTISCENVFQAMELGSMAPGSVLAPPGGSADANWLAAAQAAAAADGGLHGWTLRVM